MVTASTKAKTNYVRASIPTAFVRKRWVQNNEGTTNTTKKMIRGAELIHSLTQNLLGGAGCDSKQA